VHETDTQPLLADEPVYRPFGYDELSQYTREIDFPMPSTTRTGSLLRTLAASKPGGHLLELGTGTGLGTSWLLSGMDEDARLITVDNDPTVTVKARELFGGDDRVTFVTADAVTWLEDPDRGPFDLVFADCIPGKFTHRRSLLTHLRKGALYIGDDLIPNASWIEPGHEEMVGKFLPGIAADDEVIVTLMAWSSGMIVAVKR
jgi:predicted O-methyltransferase YrrM